MRNRLRETLRLLEVVSRKIRIRGSRSRYRRFRSLGASSGFLTAARRPLGAWHLSTQYRGLVGSRPSAFMTDRSLRYDSLRRHHHCGSRRPQGRPLPPFPRCRLLLGRLLTLGQFRAPG